MTEYKNALHHLIGDHWFSKEDVKYIKLIKELVNKEAPMKPVTTIHNCSCQMCNYAFGRQRVIDSEYLGHKFLQYCPTCGQRIDWSDEE